MIANKILRLALIILSTSVSLSAQIKKSDSLSLVSLSDQAVLHYENGNTDSSRIYFLKTISRVRELQKTYPKEDYLQSQLVNSMDYLSSILYNQGNIHQAISYADSVIKYFESLNDSFNVALSLNNIGYMYQSQNLTDKATENYTKALNILLNKPTEEGKIYIGILYNNIGLIHDKNKDYETAISYFKQSLEIRRNINDKRGISESLNNIGNALRKMDRIDEALQYLLEAISIKKEINDVGALSFSLNNVAIIYFLKGNLDLSKKYAIESQQYAVKTGNLEALTQINKSLSKISYKEKDYKKAHDYLQQFIIYNDSMISINNKKALYKHQVQYEFDKKEALAKAEQEKKEALTNEKLRRQKVIIYSVLLGLILLIFTIIVIYKSYVNKKRSNIELTNKNLEITQQKHVIEEKTKEILDSINYAKRIQAAILPPKKLVNEYLKNYFILYKPKDIVAGDFYWVEKISNKSEDIVLFAAADCTGHGVPGAMVSVVCNNALNRSVREYGLKDPAEILDKTRDIVVQEFEKSEDEVKDGMDISLCSLSVSPMRMKWSGANNPVWIIRKKISAKTILSEHELTENSDFELIELKANKQPIGKFATPSPFTSHDISLLSGDTIYIFTDGFQDQFGGEKGKKFKASQLKSLLLSIQPESMEKQKEILETTLDSWKGDLEQVDDICVFGVRV